jgi:hypothetical protein
MSKTGVFIVALAVALLSEPARPEDPAAAPPPYKPVARLTEDARKAMFADLHACRAEVGRKADAQYADRDGQSAAATTMRQRQRLRYASSGQAVCGQRIMRLHRLQKAELEQIEREGTCRQWAPLAGSPTCG